MDNIEETKEKGLHEEPDSTYHLNGNAPFLDDNRDTFGDKIREDVSHQDSDNGHLLDSPKGIPTEMRKTSKVTPGSDSLGSGKENATNGSKLGSKTAVFPKTAFDDETALPLGVETPVAAPILENLDVYKRSGTYIEYADEIESELDRAKILHFGESTAVDETDEEDNVYPLSIKFNKAKACRVMLLRYFFLLVFLFLLVPTDLYTFGEQRKLPQRTGFFANRIWEEELSISGVTNFNVATNNCIIYFLENKESTDKVDLYVSAEFGATVDTNLAGTVRNIKVTSAGGWVK